MGQAMVGITDSACTGCDLCIPFCPFEALLPLMENPTERKHPKRPVVVVEAACVGCLSCIGSCPTGALHEIPLPPKNEVSPLLEPPTPPDTAPVLRWGRHGIGWP
ncbi:MAG: 4Fe-4S binding protein [Candidatus Poseidoniaceae archaeon]